MMLGDISSGNGLIVLFPPARREPNPNRPAKGAPLDATQHPEELSTRDSLDLFLEHCVQTLDRYEL